MHPLATEGHLSGRASAPLRATATARPLGPAPAPGYSSSSPTATIVDVAADADALARLAADQARPAHRHALLDGRRARRPSRACR